MSRLIQKSIRMPCHPKYLSEVRTFLDSVLDEAKIDRHRKDLLILAVDEAVSSIVTYARFKGFENEVSLSIDVDDVRFKAVIVDSLNVFDLNGGIYDTNRIAQERTFKMGIFLMRHIMDEIVYTYRKGFENELQLIKFV